MNHLSFSGLMICITSALCAILTYFPRPHNAIKTIWSLLCISVSLWGYGLFRAFATPDADSALFWSRFLNISAIFIPIYLYHFALLFTNKYIRMLKMLIMNYVFGALLIILILIFPQWFVAQVIPKLNFAHYPDPGILYYLFSAYFAVMAVYEVILFINEYRTAPPIKKHQLKYILFGITVGYAGGSMTFLPVFNIPVYPMGTYLVIVYVFSVAYAIAKYRLMEIRFFISKVAQYLILILFVALCINVAMLLPVSMLKSLGINTRVLVTIAAVISAIIVFEDTIRIDKVINRWLNRSSDIVYNDVEKGIFNLKKMVKLGDLLAEVDNILIKLRIRSYAIYLQEKPFLDHFDCVVKKGTGSEDCPEKILKSLPLIQLVSADKQIIETEEFRHRYGHLYKKGKVLDETKRSVQDDLDRLHIDILTPLEIMDSLVGLLFIGRREQEDRYTHRDLDIIKLLGLQVSSVIETSQIYERMLSSERLSTIGLMAAEMAHEIRNPLTSIQSFVQMLPRKGDNSEFKANFNTVVNTAINKIFEVTDELIKYAEIKSPAYEYCNVAEIIDRVLSIYEAQINYLNLTIEKDYSPTNKIKADANLLHQVILNIVLNSIQASRKEGKISIRAQSTDRYFCFVVKDEGCGIKKEDLAKVFEPFYTTKVDGTGLGLSITQRIVEDHDGSISIESEEEKGAKVTVLLPINS